MSDTCGTPFMQIVYRDQWQPPASESRHTLQAPSQQAASAPQGFADIDAGAGQLAVAANQQVVALQQQVGCKAYEDLAVRQYTAPAVMCVTSEA